MTYNRLNSCSSKNWLNMHNHDLDLDELNWSNLGCFALGSLSYYDDQTWGFDLEKVCNIPYIFHIIEFIKLYNEPKYKY